MRFPGVPYQPRFAADEVVLGVVAAIVLHLVIAGPFVLRAIFPKEKEAEEQPLVSRPVVQASLLKLGKPLDPKRLPERFVPQQRTAPKKQVVASREDPKVQKKDAGVEPPPNTKDSDLTNLIAKSDEFAEDAGKPRPDEGRAEGSDAGTETDPNKVQAGAAYLAQLDQFFSQRMTVPSVISIGEARKLCVLVRMNIGGNMVIWHVNQSPIIGSGNELFDDAAKNMLLKLVDDKTALPNPPPELDDQFRKRTVQLVIKGDPHGDSRRCMPK